MLEVDLKRNETLNIYPLGDLHLGASNHDNDLFNKWINTFNDDKNEKIILLLGDLVENPSDRIGWQSATKDVNSCINDLVTNLEPLKDYIRVSCGGNHEARISRKFKFDLAENIAQQIGVTYTSNDFIDSIMINEQLFRIYCKHGSRFSRKSHLFLKNFIEDINNQVICDLAIVGHSHILSWDKVPFLINNYDIKERYYCCSGSFLKYFDSYANDKGMNPLQSGFPVISVDKSCKASCEFVYGKW